jgi:hypothetical protein
MSIENVTSLRPNMQQVTRNAGFSLFGGDGLGFADLVDIANPLQHIPLVGHAYRAVTGDALSSGAALIGGSIFGGVAGAVTSGVNALLEQINGEPIASSVADSISQEQTTSLYAAPAATALAPDEGQALLALYQDGAFNPAPPAVDAAQAPLSQPKSALSAYITQQDADKRIDPLNIIGGDKAKQMTADMHKNFIDTVF